MDQDNGVSRSYDGQDRGKKDGLTGEAGICPFRSRLPIKAIILLGSRLRLHNTATHADSSSSESSLFVAPHLVILKTCGTTINLLGLTKIIEIAREYCGFEDVWR